MRCQPLTDSRRASAIAPRSKGGTNCTMSRDALPRDSMPAHLADRGADMREMVAADDQSARVRLHRRKDLDAEEGVVLAELWRRERFVGRKADLVGRVLSEMIDHEPGESMTKRTGPAMMW
jgi:hypothetical protein